MSIFNDNLRQLLDIMQSYEKETSDELCLTWDKEAITLLGIKPLKEVVQSGVFFRNLLEYIDDHNISLENMLGKEVLEGIVACFIKELKADHEIAKETGALNIL